MPPRKPKTGQSLAEKRPDLAQEWDYEKNGDFGPKDFKCGSNMKVWWTCSLCTYSWCTAICSRTQGRSCPKCANKNRNKSKEIPSNGNSLKDLYPNIAREFIENINKVSATEVKPYSSRKFSWKCVKCSYTWESTPYNRTKLNIGCPVCSGRKILIGINDISTVIKLKDIRGVKVVGDVPDNLRANSATKILWSCDLNHEWYATPHKVIGSRSGCPYCSNNKVLAGFNDVLTTHPELAAQWSDKNSKRPDEVIAGSGKHYWWVCSSGHEWKSTLNSRSSGGHGCPQCQNNLGAESFMRDVLAQRMGECGSRKLQKCHWISGRKMEVDYVYDDLIVEYDGERWHSKEGKFLNDAFKSQEMLDKGYKVVRLRQDGLPFLTQSITEISDFDPDDTYWNFESNQNFLQVSVKWDKEGRDLERVITEEVIPWYNKFKDKG